MNDAKLRQNLRTYLLGYPLHQSLAPLLHTTIYKKLDVPWTYEIVETQDKNEFLPKLRSHDCIGAAVTMPFKISFMEECDEVTEEGSAIGAINTVFIRQDPSTGARKYVGTNTDCVGVREAFLQNFPDILSQSRGRPALVVGGGGACRSAVYALYKWLGASEVYLVNRIREEVDAIVSSFAALPDGPRLRHVTTVEEATGLKAPAIIVGTVPDFPPSTEGERMARNILVEFLKNDQKGYVLEMCYHPNIVTRFYELAEANGWEVLPGTEPMVHQGIAQQVLWMERPLNELPIEAAKEAVAEALASGNRQA